MNVLTFDLEGLSSLVGNHLKRSIFKIELLLKTGSEQYG